LEVKNLTSKNESKDLGLLVVSNISSFFSLITDPIFILSSHPTSHDTFLITTISIASWSWWPSLPSIITALMSPTTTRLATTLLLLSLPSDHHYLNHCHHYQLLHHLFGNVFVDQTFLFPLNNIVINILKKKEYGGNYIVKM
jgi:hypothetical protein